MLYFVTILLLSIVYKLTEFLYNLISSNLTNPSNRPKIVLFCISSVVVYIEKLFNQLFIDCSVSSFPNLVIFFLLLLCGPGTLGQCW